MEEKSIEKRLGMPSLVHKKKVAAYCRVSVEKDAMLHSLSNQVSYYQDYIAKNDEWIYVGTYADEGISGTKVNRPEFNRLIEDCKAHKIDMIITKSISRFARNTTLLLQTTRLLKKLNIDVYFEEQKIHSLSNDGELVLSLLAGFAEEEAKSMSNNVRWKVNKFFEDGKIWGLHKIYGYDVIDGKLVVNQKEAEVIRLIYHLYLDEGLGTHQIVNRLDELNIPAPKANGWIRYSVRNILRSIIYTGELMLGKYSQEMNPISHHKENDGRYPLYYVEESHEPIISKELYERAQATFKQRNEKYIPTKENNYSPFAGLIKCASCGKNYLRKKNKYRIYWICGQFVVGKGKKCNQALSLREDTLYELTKLALDIDEVTEKSLEPLEQIMVHDSKDLDFIFKNGEKKTYHFEFKSRKESWTEEMKEEARRRGLLNYYA